MASDLTLRGTPGTLKASIDPRYDIIKRSDGFLATGKDYFRIKDYGSAEKHITSALNGYHLVGELIKEQECNALLDQITTQSLPPLVSPDSLHTSERLFAGNQPILPTSRIRRLAPLSSNNRQTTVDDRVQRLLQRLEGVRLGEVMQFPHIYKGHRTADDGKSGK